MINLGEGDLAKGMTVSRLRSVLVFVILSSPLSRGQAKAETVDGHKETGDEEWFAMEEMRAGRKVDEKGGACLRGLRSDR